VPGKMIRVVSIPDVDSEACGGLHVDRTGKIGPIRIVRSKRIQDGVVRIEYVSGMAAVKAMQDDRDTVAAVSEELNVPRNQVRDAVVRTRTELRSAQKALDSLKCEMSQNASGDLLSKAVDVDGVRVVCHMASEGEDVDQISKTLSENADVLAVVAAAGPKVRILVSRGKDVGVDCREVLKGIMSIVGGGGGGKPDFAQGGGGVFANIPGALERVKKGVFQ